jgi:hypothetical protein
MTDELRRMRRRRLTEWRELADRLQKGTGDETLETLLLGRSREREPPMSGACVGAA